MLDGLDQLLVADVVLIDPSRRPQRNHQIVHAVGVWRVRVGPAGRSRTARIRIAAMARPELEAWTPRFSGSREAPRSATKGLQIAALAAQEVVPRAPWFGLVSRGFGTPRRPRSPTEAGPGSCLNSGRRLVRGGAPAVGDLLGAIQPPWALGRRLSLGRRERPAFMHRRNRDASARPKGPYGPQSTIPGRPRTEPSRRGASA